MNYKFRDTKGCAVHVPIKCLGPAKIRNKYLSSFHIGQDFNIQKMNI